MAGIVMDFPGEFSGFIIKGPERACGGGCLIELGINKIDSSGRLVDKAQIRIAGSLHTPCGITGESAGEVTAVQQFYQLILGMPAHFIDPSQAPRRTRRGIEKCQDFIPGLAQMGAH